MLCVSWSYFRPCLMLGSSGSTLAEKQKAAFVSEGQRGLVLLGNKTRVPLSYNRNAVLSCLW